MMKYRSSRWLAFPALLMAGQIASAGEVNGLTTFSAGTPARAAEVNANFSSVKAAVDDNAADIAALTATVATLQASVTALQGELDAVTAQGPRAYAVVELQYDAGSDTYNPVLVTARTKNFTAVRRSGFTPGSYCLTPAVASALDPAATATVVSPDWGLTLATAGEQLFAYVDTTSHDCAASEFEVVTNTATGAGRSIISFSLVVP